MSRRLLRSLKLAVGASVALLGTQAQAQDVKEPVSDELDEDVKGETAIFARFGDLGSEDTSDRLDALLKDKTSAELLASIGKALSSDKVTSKDIEKQMLSLLKGLKIEVSDETVAAVMLDYYEQQVADRLADGDLKLSDAMDELLDRADVVVTAAYGATSPKGKKTPRYHTIRKLRRRV